MIQGCQHLRFALETGKPFGIVRKRFGQDFDGYVTAELGISRRVHFAHAARTNCREDFIRAQTLTDLDGHGLSLSWNWQSITPSTTTRLNSWSLLLPDERWNNLLTSYPMGWLWNCAAVAAPDQSVSTPKERSL